MHKLVVALAEELSIADSVHFPRNQLLLTGRAAETVHVVDLV